MRLMIITNLIVHVLLALNMLRILEGGHWRYKQWPRIAAQGVGYFPLSRRKFLNSERPISANVYPPPNTTRINYRAKALFTKSKRRYQSYDYCSASNNGRRGS